MGKFGIEDDEDGGKRFECSGGHAFGGSSVRVSSMWLLGRVSLRSFSSLWTVALRMCGCSCSFIGWRKSLWCHLKSLHDGTSCVKEMHNVVFDDVDGRDNGA